MSDTLAFLRKRELELAEQIEKTRAVESALEQVAGDVKAAVRDYTDCRKELASLRSSQAGLLNALKSLYALVQGECPSLLEDDHHDGMVREAIKAAASTGKAPELGKTEEK